MNWLSSMASGDNDDDSHGEGWEEDVDLDDYFDTSAEGHDDTVDEDTEVSTAAAAAAAEETHPPTVTRNETLPSQSQPTPTDTSSITLGNGLFMGRLTRFLEAVSQPTEAEEQVEENGWNEDDDVFDDVDDEDHNNETGQGEAGWGEADDDLAGLDSDEGQFTTAAEDVNHANVSMQVQTGLLQDSSFAAQPSSTLQHDFTVPLNDHLKQEPAPTLTTNAIQPPPPPSSSSIGWEDDVAIEETTMDESSMSNQARVGTSAANSSNAGWDDELEGLDGLDDDNTPPVVDHTPPPPPPPQAYTPSREISAQTQSVSFAGVSTAAVVTSISDGWGSDEDQNDWIAEDYENSEHGKGTSIATTSTTELQTEPKQPPPPPTSMPSSNNREESLTVSFAEQSADAVAMVDGWDDNATLDDLDEYDAGTNQPSHMASAEIQTTAATGARVVDLTPPPPLPPGHRKNVSAVAIANDSTTGGWDGDDAADDVDENVGNLATQSEDTIDNHSAETPLVDHTPPPPLPHRATSRDAITLDLEDDDISRDDTLSIANSRARYEEQQYLAHHQAHPGPPLVDQIPPSLSKTVQLKRVDTIDAIKSNNSVGSSTIDDFKQSTMGDTTSSNGDGTTPLPTPAIVDHTPSLSSGTYDRNASTEASMLVLPDGTTGGTHTESSIGDSLDSFSDRMSTEFRPRLRRVVDHTPPTARFRNGLPIDTSLAVAGHTSVGESLDSIDEEDEEPESPKREMTPTPVAVEAGWAGEARRNRRDFSISTAAEENTAIPFGSAITPTATGGSRPADADGGGDDDEVPLVDHTPHPLSKQRSTAASVEVLSVSSEEGDLGESIVGMDDVKEDLYGQVVDHTPATPRPPEQPTSSLTGNSENFLKQEDDTVVGVAEKTDVEGDFKQDDEMDDESSRGTNPTLEDYENRSLVSFIPLTIPEEKQLVDHVPSLRHGPRTADASTVVFADASAASSVEGDIVNDDATSPAGFGPIVDQLPSIHMRSVRSIATSVVTQNSGLDVDLKEDEDLDNTVSAAISGDDAQEDGWENEQESLAPLVSEEKHLVDHVPKRSNSRPAVDGSMQVLVDNGEDMTQVDTIAEDTVVGFGPIVDHTPFSTRSVGYSVAASMATQPDKHDDESDNSSAPDAYIDGGDGWANDVPDLEDISEGEDHNQQKETDETALVDHVPRRSFPRPTDASTVVVVDPQDAASEAGDDDTAGNTVPHNRFGPVVDHTPAPPSSEPLKSVAASMRTQASDARNETDMDGGTWYGASTVGGVSTVGASGGASTAADDSTGEGWDDDGDMLDSLVSPITQDRSRGSRPSHLVDHVPRISAKRPEDASTAVVVDPSVASSQNKEQNEDTMDGGSFGAVVDHTPSVSKRSLYSVANSVATIASGIATDIKRDEEMDETTWNEGVSGNGDGWDQEEAELDELADADEDQMPPLVDHVPERPESRPTDASTIVAGDPSEMFSQVDDLGHDETLFGPVVDVTPHLQLRTHPSVAGSTIVNIASVVEDDLDVAVENAIDGEDPNGASQEQSGWQETLPNPQSGNEEPDEDREQLVDYVPDEQEEEVPDLVRDGSSEMATVGEKSTMIPPDDPKEDEFGPVVDHTPVSEVQGSSSSIGTGPTEPKSDRKKPARSPPVFDSIVPALSSESKDNRDDGLEEDEFGPVVDQLPTISSRAAFPPSRGGSTVDALATVSEVDDDYIPGDGWEDDVDIDAAEQQSPVASTRSGEDRNLSVKWIDRLSESDSAALLQKSGNVSRASLDANDSTFYDAQTGEFSRLSLNETRYYDPELGNTSTWGSLPIRDVDNAEDDDTPPSTPRSSFESRQKVENGGVGGNASLLLVASNRASSSCKACENADTADCPCVKRLIEANEGRDRMVGSMRTPEGKLVKINFEELLKTEMTKRRLVEKEFQALRAIIESLKSSKDSLVLAGETQMDVLNKMQASNKSLAGDLENVRAETNGLRMEKAKLQTLSEELQNRISTMESEKRTLEEQALALNQEVDLLQSKMAEISYTSTSKASERESELQSEISKWKRSNGDLLHKIARFETECENLRGKNESLYEDLSSYRESISKLEEEKASMLSKESALSVEINNLRKFQATASHDSLQSQIVSLQAEVATKTGECTDLRVQVESLQRKVTLAQADSFKQAKEVARISKEKSTTITSFETRIAQTRHEMEEALRMKDEALEALKSRLDKECATTQNLRESLAASKMETQRNANAQKDLLTETLRKLDAAERGLDSSKEKVRLLEQENKKLTVQVAEKDKEWKLQKDANAGQFFSVTRERDGLKQALEESNATIANMQRMLDEQAETIATSATQHKMEVAALSQERAELVSSLSKAGEEVTTISQLLGETQKAKNQLEKSYSELSSQFSNLQKSSSETFTSAKREAALQDEIQRLKSQLTASDERSEAILVDYTKKNKEYDELAMELEDVRSELDEVTRTRVDMETKLDEFVHEIEELRSVRDSLKKEYRDLELSYRELETSSARELVEAQSTSHQQDLFREVDHLRAELHGAKLREGDYVKRIHHLENEITDAKNSIAKKDHAIALLEDQKKADEERLKEMTERNRAVNMKGKELEATVAGYSDERRNLELASGEYSRSIASLNDDLKAITKERDTYLQERKMLEEENEEMLVQFGLLKEQMDSTDAEVAELQDALNLREKELSELQEKLHLSETELNQLKKGSNRIVKDSEGENLAKLEKNINSLKSDNEILREKLRGTEREKESLLSQVSSLQLQSQESLKSFNEKEAQLLMDVELLEKKCEKLTTENSLHAKTISDLQASIAEFESVSEKTRGLQLQLEGLQVQLSERDRLLQQKDGAIEDLQFQLENDGWSPTESAEVATLRETVLNLQEKAERDRSNYQGLEAIAEETARELKKKGDELASTECLVRELKNAIEDLGKTKQENTELQALVQETESRIEQANQDAASVGLECANLRSRLAVLQSELEMSQQKTESAMEASGESTGELASSSSSQHRDKAIEQEHVTGFKEQTLQKDMEITRLRNELERVESELSSNQHELSSKHEHIALLSAELEKLRSLAKPPKVLPVAESVDEMRSYVVSLAKALEKSEGRRAEAIEQLEKERKSNADGLRRLTESVKRFYSSLSFGEK